MKMKTKPKIKPIHRIIAFPFQIIGFIFATVFFIIALIFPPWHPKRLFKAAIEGLRENREETK